MALKPLRESTPTQEFTLSSTYSDQDLLDMFNNNSGVSIENNSSFNASMLTTTTNGIEGLPYQFLSTADRRIDSATVVGDGVGRKYADKIFSRLPLLFLTPCEPLFMDDFDENEQETIAGALLGNAVENLEGTLEKTGRYYSVIYNYDEYYAYLNTMLAAVASYMGVYSETILVNGVEKKVGSMSWNEELNGAFKTFFSSAENVIFYLDGMNSVNENFSNDTTESSLAAQINGYSDNINELKFLFGRNNESLISASMNTGASVAESVAQGFSGLGGMLGGGIVESIANGGIHSILNGGKIIFPEIWSNSNFDRSYSIEVKLRSPDNDNLSIFLNIIKPYCKLLALALPRQMYTDDKMSDPNTYGAPFLVKAYSKGLFNVDMGIISSLSVTKGAECRWNDFGLPTQLDISIEIKDLYNHMAMSAMAYGTLNVKNVASSLLGVVNNTAYMDFLANMAGLNIGQMEMGRRATMLMYLSQTYVNTAVEGAFLKLSRGVSNLANRIYNII